MGSETEQTTLPDVLSLIGRLEQTTVVRGAVGAGKALLRISRARKEDIEKRLSLCRSCSHLDKHSRCDLCKCFVLLKTTITSESCPEGKWSATAPRLPVGFKVNSSENSGLIQPAHRVGCKGCKHDETLL